MGQQSEQQAAVAVIEDSEAAAPVEKQPEASQEPVVAYKAFGLDWKCRDYQYALGQTYEHDGPVAACESGFHACENPIDMFRYYEPGSSRFALVELTGELSRHEDDSKIAAARIAIKAEIGIPEIVAKTVAFVAALCKPSNKRHATGDSSASSATGNRSASSATGYSSASSATGNRSASSATGDSSASSATGYSSASSATGDSSASSATGYSSASSATGYRSASSATGNSSASLATGWAATSEIKPAPDGKPLHAIAIAAGCESRARAPAGSAIVLTRRDREGRLLHIFASKVGDSGIEPDKWYRLNADGKPEEAA